MAASSGLKIVKLNNGDYSVTLPQSIKQAIEKFNPGFRVWNTNDYMPSVRKYYTSSKKQNLSSVIGDFNGDKISDVILQGTDSKKEYGLWVYLTHVNPGDKKSPYEKSKLKLTNDAFEVQYFEKASVLYYYDGKKFQKYTNGD